MKRLESSRLLLREWSLNDSKDIYEYAKSDLVGPNAGWKPHKNEDESKSIIKIFIEDNDVYAIVLKSENKVIGSIGIHERTLIKEIKDKKIREIGYVLSPSYWGNEYMKEAVNTVLDYCFNELKLDLVTCGHYDFNDRSKRVIEKCGFKKLFSKKTKLERLDNREVDLLYYSLSKDDYMKNIK